MKFALLLLFLGIGVSARGAAAVTRARYLMGTICEVEAPDAREIDAAFDEAARIERLISTWRSDSELSLLNASGEAHVSPELYGILHISVDVAHESSGAFNPLVRPLIDLWQTRGSGRVPSPQERELTLPRLALSNITFDRGVVRLTNRAQVEEGGFGKGYALDKMLEKITALHAVLNFGGQILVRGSERVTIAHPLHRDRPLLALTLTNGSLSTSSGSEKSFNLNGVRFSHLLDPTTGMALPPRGSVSVIGHSAFFADMFSTALYVMGPERGLRWARMHDVVAIFISETGDITTSSPVAGLTMVKELP